MLYRFFLFLALFGAACHSEPGRNRLGNASSPYLLQHADNPVHWYEWGEAALSAARASGKPLLISIGYASCHWCHVMESESFMDPEVANFMNQHFICVKVDREERPDVDQIYQDACMLINGNAGWPLNAFALANGQPFFAGTYFPKDKWMQLMAEMSESFQERREQVEQQAAELTQGVAAIDLPFKNEDAQEGFSKDLYQDMGPVLLEQMDVRNGGLAGAPKFPMPALLSFLMQYQAFTGDPKARQTLEVTLDKMALGGLYDQLGGGFARYATDSLWRVPHFEKMLYDNAQLLSLYAQAYQMSGNPFYRQIAESTARFMLRDLRGTEGGFFSSVNAVSEGREGAFYTWTYEELQKNLPSDDFSLVESWWSVRREGNWENRQNILYATAVPRVLAAQKGMSLAALEKKLASIKDRLVEIRNRRPRPETDTKILAAWNALAIQAFADGYAATGEMAFLDAALGCADFIRQKMRTPNGGLYRNFINGKASIDGFLDDYALTARAFIRLYEVTFDKKWLEEARRITDLAIEQFYDNSSAAFFYTPAQHTLAVRKMEMSDGVLPSSNAVMCEVLFRLGTYWYHAPYLDKSRQLMNKAALQMVKQPEYYAHWACNAGLMAYGPIEVAVAGPDARSLAGQLMRAYTPACLFLGSTQQEDLPLLEGKMAGAQTMIYVCNHQSCKLPLSDVSQALELIQNEIGINKARLQTN